MHTCEGRNPSLCDWPAEYANIPQINLPWQMMYNQPCHPICHRSLRLETCLVSFAYLVHGDLRRAVDDHPFYRNHDGIPMDYYMAGLFCHSAFPQFRFSPRVILWWRSLRWAAYWLVFTELEGMPTANCIGSYRSVTSLVFIHFDTKLYKLIPCRWIQVFQELCDLFNFTWAKRFVLSFIYGLVNSLISQILIVGYFFL